MASAVFLWQVYAGPRIRSNSLVQPIPFPCLNRCPLGFLRSACRFTRQTEALIKIIRALIFFDSPRSAQPPNSPVGRDASNTGDVAAERDINPVSLGAGLPIFLFRLFFLLRCLGFTAATKNMILVWHE